MQNITQETFELEWGHLSAQEIGALNVRFDEDGYVILKNIIPSQQVAKFTKGLSSLLSSALASDAQSQLLVDDTDLVELLARCVKECSAKEYIGMLKVYVLSVAAKQMMFGDPLVDTLGRIFGHTNISQIGNPVMHVVGDRLKLTERAIHAPFHQDWPALKSSKRTIVCWLPIVGAVGDAALLLKPGSHKSGVFESDTLSSVFEANQDVLDRFKTVSFDLNPGDVILFDSFLLHGSVPTEKERVAISFRYEDIDCLEWRARYFASNHRYFLVKE